MKKCLPEQQTRAGTSNQISLTPKTDNNMKAKYIKPEMANIDLGVEDVILQLSTSEQGADPSQPQETKEEKNAWNEGLW